MNNQYIMLTLNDLRKIIALSGNRSLNYNEILENDNGASVAFYLNQDAAEDGEEPKETITLASAQPYARMINAAKNVRYILDNPAASVDFKGVAYWAQEYEKATKDLLYNTNKEA